MFCISDHDCEHHVPDFWELSSKAIFCQTLKSKKQEKKKTCIIELIQYPKLLETGLHSLKLTSPLKMMVSNRNLVFQVYFQGYVSFWEGSCEKSCYSWCNSNLGLVWRSRNKQTGWKQHVTTILGILGPHVLSSNCAGQEEYIYICINMICIYIYVSINYQSKKLFQNSEVVGFLPETSQTNTSIWYQNVGPKKLVQHPACLKG